MNETKHQKLSLEALNRISIEQYKKSEKFDFAFILDDIRSLQNVGTFFRTGDSFRISHIYLCGITGKPPHRDIQKTALGATESVAWSYHNSCEELLESLKSEGWKICSLEQAENSEALQDYRFKKGEKYAFIFGNEVKGVNQALINKSDAVLEIPQFGTKHSLNVSVSAGIVAWDFYSKTIGKTLKKPL